MSRILLIEDQPVNRKLIGDILRRAGHEVREPTTADEGVPIEKRILAAGCDGYVAKPIAYRLLLAEVARLVSLEWER